MRVELKDIVRLFEKIQEELNINYVSIVLFTALDVDSLCTLKILTVPPSTLSDCSSQSTSTTKSTQ